jgi:hypothetical protein
MVRKALVIAGALAAMAVPASAGTGSVLPDVTISYSCAGAQVTTETPSHIRIDRKPYRGNYALSVNVFDATSAFSVRPSYWSRVIWNVEVNGKFAGSGSVANCPV